MSRAMTSSTIWKYSRSDKIRSAYSGPSKCRAFQSITFSPPSTSSFIHHTLFLSLAIPYIFYSHRNALTNTISLPQPYDKPNSNLHHPYPKNDHLTTSTTPHNLTYTRLHHHHRKRNYQRTPPPHKIPLQRPLPKAPSPSPLLLPQRPPTHPLPKTQKTPRSAPPQTHHLTTSLPIADHISLLPQHRLPRIPLRRAGRRRRRRILGVRLRPTDPHILGAGGAQGAEWRAGDDGRGGVRGVCATEDVGADEGGDAC